MSPKFFRSPRNVTVQNVMPFYPDIIMAPKIWLSPRNVTLENVTTYFVRQMNRPYLISRYQAAGSGCIKIKTKVSYLQTLQR